MRRCLKIVASAISLTACALLIALWVRSYSYFDNVTAVLAGGDRAHWLESIGGEIRYAQPLVSPIPHEPLWRTAHGSCREYLQDPSHNYPSVLGFRWERVQSGRYEVAIPYWFIVLVSAAPFALGRRWRFTVRALLVAMTFIAVTCTLIVIFQ